jgi:hypothetical protein
MAQNPAAIPRRSCPACGRLTRVPLLQFLPASVKEKGFRCSSCNERIRVAKSTQVIAYWGGLLALGATVLAVWLLVPSLASAVLFPRQASDRDFITLLVGILAVSAAFPIFGALLARLALRLELWLDESL